MKNKSILLLCAAYLGSMPLHAATVEQVEEGNSLPTDTVSSLYDELDELVITAKKEIVKSDGRKLTYDLDQDDTSKGQSVLDALRKVPMVQVDGQDNIYIKGNQNFKIYVNGKENPMLTANAAKVLKAMPSESVSKIEVITEPGAKYDAEGTAGILNLVTERKQTKDGYAGQVNGTYTSQNTGASLYGKTKYGNVTADANLNYYDNTLQGQSSRTHSETIDENSDSDYRQLMDINQKFKFKYVGASLNLSWEPSDRDLFTAGGNCTWMDGKISKLSESTRMFTRSGNPTYAFLQDISGGLLNLSATGNGSYKRTFSDKGNNLVAAYAFAFGKMNMDLDYLNENVLNSSLPEAQSNANHNYDREHTATLDYTQPFASGRHTLETGIKGVFRRNGAVTNAFAGNSPDVLIATEEGLTRQLQDVYAAYAAYSGSFKDKWAVQAGLRYERTHMGMDFLKGHYPDYRRNLNDIAPNAALTYIFGPATNLRLSYQERISRPGLSQMNPYEFRITQNSIRVGNPDLESEKYRSLTLTYSNYGRIIGGNIGVEARQSTNTIEEFNSFDNGVWTETYGNFGHNHYIALSGFLNWNISQRMSLGVNADVNYTQIKARRAHLENHGWKCNYSANWSYRGPADIKYSIYGGQSTGRVQLQGDFSGWYWYGLSVGKSFLKDEALTLTLNAGNFFTKYHDFRSKTVYGNTTQKSVTENRNWNVGLTVAWNFGHLKDQVKKTGASIQNTDKKESGSGNGLGL